MKADTKVSPTLLALLSESEASDRQDAIVIYRSEPPAGPKLRGRLRDLDARLKSVEARAEAQQRTQAHLLEQYQQDGARRLSKPEPPLKTRDLGRGVLPVMAVEVSRKTLGALTDQPDVLAVMPNQRIALIKPNAVDFKSLTAGERKDALTWGLKQLEIPELWRTTRGAGIKVAVLDTGVHGDHPALAGRVEEFIIVDRLGRRIAAEPSFDADEHGTHVCGTIAGGLTADGVAIGVAPQASLLVAGVLIGRSTSAALIQGLAWAIERGADVINLSLGFTCYEPMFTGIFDLVLDSGALPVVAIGNESHGNSSSPGSAYNALAVGAVERQTGGQLAIAPFSSGASLNFPGTPQSLVVKPDLAAPGAQVYSSIPPRKTTDGSFDYNYMDGTSMAAPHVSGVAALLLAAEPEVPLDLVIQVLKETACHPEGTGRRPDNRWGHGMVRPLEALKALQS